MARADGPQSGSPHWKWLIGLTIVALALTGFWWWVIYPNFKVMQTLSRQIEAKTKLALIFEAEHAFHEKHHRYGNFDEIGFPSPQDNNRRYTYRLDGSGSSATIRPAAIGLVTPDDSVVRAGLSSDGQSFTATATAQLDSDETIDQWHVNNLKQDLDQPDTNDVVN